MDKYNDEIAAQTWVGYNGPKNILEGLEEIAKITMREAAYSKTLMPKLNEIIEKVNLLIRLKEK